jgi:glycogen(starch) synthase
MRILLSSHFFYPSVGGIEQVSLTLATEFAHANHSVKVITSTMGTGNSVFPFEIIRQPSAPLLLKLVRWCHVFFHNNISLRVAWPLLFIHRPWIIAHHARLLRPDNSVGIRDRFKHLLTRFATNIAVCQPIADRLTVPSAIVGNPYRDDLFQRDKTASRNRELIFVGRLVPDKGVDLLIDAMRILRGRDFCPKLTVVGDGPALTLLQTEVERSRLANQVEFLGTRTGKDLVGLLNRHRIIVVPSRLEEPFGLVAIEGAACGCRAIASACGGLKDVLGSLAILFERGNALALAEAVEKCLKEQFDWENYWRSVDEHISRYRARRVADRYLEILEAALRLEHRT